MTFFVVCSFFVSLLLFAAVGLSEAVEQNGCSTVGKFAVCDSLCSISTDAWQITIAGQNLDWTCASQHPHLGVSILTQPG
jgi:hypothetical protein